MILYFSNKHSSSLRQQLRRNNSHKRKVQKHLLIRQILEEHITRIPMIKSAMFLPIFSLLLIRHFQSHSKPSSYYTYFQPQTDFALGGEGVKTLLSVHPCKTWMQIRSL
uniref:Uncharacterized protein MANES_04G012400 n=1 Tax=Rhizophora mucronata TaxID=61149 RepID=A0A2P2KQL8_RHIMU